MLTTVYKTRLISFLTLFFFAAPAFSAYGHVYLGTSLGGSFAKLGHSTPQISYDSIVDAYPLNDTQTSAPILSVNGGYEFVATNGRPAIALGLGVYGNLASYNYKGQLIETAVGDPSSTLYNYTYNVNSTRILAEIQFTWMLGKLSPFINFGVGPVWNKMYGYTETALTSTGFPPLQPFQSHTNVSLAYQAGLGVSTAFNFAGSQSDFSQERISIGYRYVNLGTAFSRTRGSAYPYQLNIGSLQTNDIYLSYTHLF